MKVFIVACLVLLVYVASTQVNSNAQTEHQQHPEGQPADMMLTGDMVKDMRMMNKMMVKDLGKGDGEYDARFIDMMIPHHEGAVMMAKDALQNANHQDLKEMAAKMIKDQQKEIDQLKKWRQEWYGQTKEHDKS